MYSALATLFGGTTTDAAWILGGVIAVLLVYIGLALCVALRHPDPAARADNARRILKMLLDVLVQGRRRGR